MSDPGQAKDRAARLLAQGRDAAAIVVDGNRPHLADALFAFREAGRLDPSSYAAAHSEGIVLEHLKRWEEAVEAFARAVDLERSAGDARFRLSECLDRLRRYEEAAECLAGLCDIEPQHGEAWVRRGHYLLFIGRTVEAHEVLTRAAQVVPEDRRVQHHLALANMVLGRLDDAAAALRRMTGPAAEGGAPAIVDLFHIYNYWVGMQGGRTIQLAWFGYECQKSPADMWVYQEIIFETRPDLIVECGTFRGGSALYFASLMDLLGSGQVISVDNLERPGRPTHPGITYIQGSSVDPEIVASVRRHIQPGMKVMVILDSDHSCEHVRAELQAYAALVSPGCYLVVEDTSIGFNPVWNPTYGNDPGPAPALREFLATAPHFEVDRSRERFMLTVCPGGFLRRAAG